MCGRYNVTPDAEAFLAAFDIAGGLDRLPDQPLFNIAPGDSRRATLVPIVRATDQGRELAMAIICASGDDAGMLLTNFPPRGWAQCDGQILPIDQNQSLFSLLGTTYGGDGRTTFALPDLRERAQRQTERDAHSTQRGGVE